MCARIHCEFNETEKDAQMQDHGDREMSTDLDHLPSTWLHVGGHVLGRHLRETHR